MSRSVMWSRLLCTSLFLLPLLGCPEETDPGLIDERCSDGVDNNGDGAIDCEDVACAAFPTCTGGEHCYNGIDDDGDGATDCEDERCQGTFLCLPDIEDCANGRDDDFDGDVDCDDSACARTSVCQAGAEACVGGLDEDEDGDIDCDDDDCKAVFVCLATFELPGNMIDDDGDGDIDCDDADIARTSDCLEGGEVCDNALDDDGDGAVSCADVDCALTATCLRATEVCNNGLDDDGNGLTDCADPRCADTGFCGVEVCRPGTGDEDGNGLADCADPVCEYSSLCLVDFVPPDLCTRDAQGVPDCADLDCAMEAECVVVVEGEELCDDGVDNDLDGLTDCEDVEDCLLPFVDDGGNTCIQEMCADDNGAVNTIDTLTEIVITSDAEMQAQFPAQGGPSLVKGTLTFRSDGGRFTITPGHSLRCVLPNAEGEGLLNITNTSLSDFSGLVDLRMVQGMKVELWDDFPGFTGLQQLTHILGSLEFDVDRGTTIKPTAPLSFQGFDALKTMGDGIVYLKKIDPMEPGRVTRVFDFDGLDELVEVRGSLVTLQGSADETDPCRWQPDPDRDPELRDGQVTGSFFQIDSFVGLNNLRRIDGDLCIAPTDAFLDFEELENLESIGGDFMINWPDGPLGATPADAINFNGLQRLERVGGTFALARSRTVDPPEAVCRFTVDTYNGLQGLTSVGEHMSLCLTQGFSGFDAFGNLARIEGDLYLIGEPGDTSSPSTPMQAFTSLTGIGGTLLMQDTAIDSLDGLGLSELGGLELYRNSSLTSIQALGGITALARGNLHIDDTNALTDATGLDDLVTVQGYAAIIGNRSFLDAMGSLERVEGKLYLSRLFNVTDLTAFGSLQYFGGLGLLQMPDLMSLNGLPRQTSVTGDVLLSGLGDNADLGLLGDVVTIGGYLRVEDCTLNNLPFMSLTQVGGEMSVLTTSGMNDMSGLQSLGSVGGPVTIGNNLDLLRLDGLNNLTSLSSLALRDNPVLGTLVGIQNVTRINGTLEISGCEQLQSPDSLTGLTSLGALIVINNATLEDLSGLDNLPGIDDFILIQGNRAMTSLNGLTSLVNIGGDIAIIDNDMLPDLLGLQNNITIFGGDLLTVRDNALITTCDANALLTTLQDVHVDMTVTVMSDIANNNPSCM